MSALSVPAVIVNDATVGIKPNSLSYTEGDPERKKRTASFGGSVVETVTTEDITTRYSMMKFTLLTTSENISLHKSWQSRKDNNTVGWIEEGISRTITNAAIVNKPEINPGFEGEFEIEFQGDPAI